MTRLRKMMLEELQRRNFSPTTIKGYPRALKALKEGLKGDSLNFDKQDA